MRANTRRFDVDTVYPVAKALVLDALAAEGVPKEDVLKYAGLSEASLSSPGTRVSLNQIVDFYRYAAEHSRDPHFAYHIGQRFHVSAYGMYGFAILSSINYRQTMQIAVKYHQFAMPLTAIEFTENNGYGIWLLNPVSHPRIDARLYKFIIEMKFGIFLSLHRDIMGPSFSAREFQVTYPPTHGASEYPTLFGAPVSFGRSANRLLFDSSWLDGTPRLGNEITYSTVVKLCDAQLEEFRLYRGLVGQVRQIIMKIDRTFTELSWDQEHEDGWKWSDAKVWLQLHRGFTDADLDDAVRAALTGLVQSAA